MKCDSRYKSPYNGDIVGCFIEEPHLVHRDDTGYVWRNDAATEEEVNVPVETPVKESVLDKQVGGDHYKGASMQPFDVIDAFDLNYYEGSALKYLLRWRKKNGVEDLEKAKHYIEIIIEKESNK